MNKVRTCLDAARAEQLQEIAQHYGFDSIAGYLDDHIGDEWRKLHQEQAPPLPGFEIHSELSEKKEPIVIFAANGTVPLTMDAIHAEYFAHGIDLVLTDQQKSFFFVSQIDDSILLFDKKGNGYRLMIKWNGGEWKRGLSESLARDLRDIFKASADKAGKLSGLAN